MKNEANKVNEKRIQLGLDHLDAKIVYHFYENLETNTFIVAFQEEREVLSTVDGYRKVHYAANSYISPQIEKLVMTIEEYNKYEKQLPLTFGVEPSQITLMSTGVSMDKLAAKKASKT